MTIEEHTRIELPQPARWSSPIDRSQGMNTILGPEYKVLTLDDYFDEISKMKRPLVAIASRADNPNLQNPDLEINREAIEEFYFQWDEKYCPLPDRNLYQPGPNLSEFHAVLTALTGKNLDVRYDWRNFKNEISEIWASLPNFYSIHEEVIRVKKPDDYDPSKPYPKLEIPNDIYPEELREGQDSLTSNGETPSSNSNSTT